MSDALVERIARPYLRVHPADQGEAWRQPGNDGCSVTDRHLDILTGWGRTSPVASLVATPSDAAGVARLFSESPVIARGLGRSYGDAAQNAGGTVVDTSQFDAIGPIDPLTGLVEVGGGTSLDSLIRASLRWGWFIPVSPGTRQVTVGGAIAADVHGKNHHGEGSFCSYVSSLTLVTPVGPLTIGPDHDPELFWATAGGMGLTGIIVAATLRLTRVQTGFMLVDTERFDDLDATMSHMAATDHHYRYSVAWLDCSCPRQFGRSVLTRGDHAPTRALPRHLKRRAVSLPARPRVAVPSIWPNGVVGPSTIRAFNALWFHKAPRQEHGAVVPLGSFFHPLDAVNDWNRLYGRRGLVQYQFVVDPAHAAVVPTVLHAMSAAGISSAMAVLKRFGPGDPGPLSFPIEGWTLALDFPAGVSGLSRLLGRCDDLVAEAGGRVYLAKDAHLRPEHLRAMYPRLADLETVRTRVDPERRLQSDLSRRLRLGSGT